MQLSSLESENVLKIAGLGRRRISTIWDRFRYTVVVYSSCVLPCHGVTPELTYRRQRCYEPAKPEKPA
jgi:hypothetical protein